MPRAVQISKETMLEMMDGLQKQSTTPAPRARAPIALGLGAAVLAASGRLPALMVLRTLLPRMSLAIAAALAVGAALIWFLTRPARQAARLLRTLAARRKQAGTPCPQARARFLSTLREAVEHNAIAPANACGFIQAVEAGLLPAEQAQHLLGMRLDLAAA